MTRLWWSFKALVGLACAYEAVTISLSLAGVKDSPTISREVGVYGWLGVPILGGLAVHLYWPQVQRFVTWLRTTLNKRRP